MASDLPNSTNSPHCPCSPIQPRFKRVKPTSLTIEKGSRCAAYDCEINSQEQQRNQQIPFPMIAQRDAERDSRQETDDVGDVSDVRVVAGYPALLVDHDDAANEMDYCNKSARRRRVSLGIECLSLSCRGSYFTTRLAGDPSLG
jgi:hypothetical protein